MSSNETDGGLKLGTIALDSFRAVLTVFTIVMIGFLLVHKHIFTPASLQFMSKLSGKFLLPVLIFKSFGNGPTASTFETLWVLVAVSIFSSAFDAFIAFIVAKVTRVELWFQRWFVVMNAFPNLLSVPLVVVESLCNQIEFDDAQALRNDNVTRSLSRTECISQGQVYVFLYALPFTLILFVGGVFYVSNSVPFPEEKFTAAAAAAAARRKNSQVQMNAVTDSETPSSLSRVSGSNMWMRTSGEIQTTRKSPKSVNFAAVVDATIDDNNANNSNGDNNSNNNIPEINNYAGEQSTLDQDWSENTANLRPIRKSETAASIIIPDRAASASVATNAGPIMTTNMSAGQRLKFAFFQPTVVSMVIALIVGLTPPVRDVIYGKDGALRPFSQATDTLADAAVPLSNLIIAGTLASAFKQSRVGYMLSPNLVGLSVRTTVVCVFTKMILIPAVHFPMIYVLENAIPKNRLQVVVLYVEAMMPTANLVVVLAHLLLHKRAAEAIALIMVAQYVVSIVSLMGFTGLGLYLSAL